MSAAGSKPDRRDVLIGTARGIALALLGGSAAALALRNGVRADCSSLDRCGACRLRRTCDQKPRARDEGRR